MPSKLFPDDPRATPSPPRVHGWALRHVTKLCLAVGILLFADGLWTNFVVAELDERFDATRQDEDTPSGWQRYVEQGGRPEKARVELERLHAVARMRLSAAGAPRPDGLDPLLALVRDATDAHVFLEAEALQVDRASFLSLGGNDIQGAEIVAVGDQLRASDYACASGMSAAFAAALGEEIVEVATPDGLMATPTDASPRIELSWSARASGTLYGGRADRKLFPGFAVSASVRLVASGTAIAEVDATVDPGEGFEYTTWRLAFDGPDPDDVMSGMTEAVCRSLGEMLIGELTGWAPAAGSRLGGRGTAEEECEKSDANACLVAGEPLRESDPTRALALFEKGCGTLGLGAGQACFAAGEVALAHPDDPLAPRARAKQLFEQGCEADHPASCAQAAELALVPYEPGRATIEYQFAEAYPLYLRACDLGVAASCTAAAAQAAVGRGLPDGVASPTRALLLHERACSMVGDADACSFDDALRKAAEQERNLLGVALARGDHPFDVRWGMWFEHEATEVVWVASSDSVDAIAQRLAPEIARGLARVYEPRALPPGPTLTTNANAVYALARAPLRGGTDVRRCPECTADSGSPILGLFCRCLPAR